MEKTTIICKTISGIISTLVLGEVFGNAISRPIAVWRGKTIGRSSLGHAKDAMILTIHKQLNKEDEA